MDVENEPDFQQFCNDIRRGDTALRGNSIDMFVESKVWIEQEGTTGFFREFTGWLELSICSHWMYCGR